MKLITVAEAARLAQVSTRTIDRWARKGAIRVVRPVACAQRRLIPAEDVDPHARLDALGKGDPG